MRKLKPSDIDTFEFIQKVINKTHKRKSEDISQSKSKKTYKERCFAIASKYKNEIEIYDHKFLDNHLEDIVNLHPLISNDEKQDYRSLYKYDAALIKQLRLEILTTNGFINEKCPLCDVNNVQTMDHYIPQAKFPLYSISPKNLIPSCTTCNVSKSENVLEGSRRRYWNVYLDEIPNEKYLYCTLSIQNGLLKAIFDIQQNNIDDTTFRLPKNTMEDQKILQTYSAGLGSVIEELSSCIQRMMQYDSTQTIDNVFSSLRDCFAPFSKSNKWDEVLKFELVKSKDFKLMMENELKRLNK